jgi:hypothetical protein
LVRRFAELHPPVAFEQGTPALVHEPDPHGMVADFAAAASHPEHEVRPRVHRGELRYPHVLEQSQDGELSLLVDQGVVGEDRKIEEQVSSRGWR